MAETRGRKFSGGRIPSKTYKIEREASDAFDALAKKSYMTGASGITMLIHAALAYADEHGGQLPTPLRLVPELEYQEFLRWKAANAEEARIRSGKIVPDVPDGEQPQAQEPFEQTAS